MGSTTDRVEALLYLQRKVGAVVTRAIPIQFYLPSTRFAAAYLKWELSDLRRRAEAALDLLRACEVCPRSCHVDRLADRFAVCKTGRFAMVASSFAHFGEEDCLRGWNGSGTIFFSMCNLRCAFCASPDTPVLTTEGFRPIGDIFNSATNALSLDGKKIRTPAGIRVWTHAGRIAPVAKAFAHPHKGELIAIKPYGLPPLRLTPNHHVYASHTLGGEIRVIPAGELSTGDYLLIPKPRCAASAVELSVQQLLEPSVTTFRLSVRRRVPIAALQELAAVGTSRSTKTSHQVGRELGYHPAYVRTLLSRIRRGLVDSEENVRQNRVIEEGGRVRFKTEKGDGIPARLILDTRLAMLLGYYCAEGHVASSSNRPNSHSLIFSYGRGERRLAHRTRELIQSLFDLEARIAQRHTTLTVEVGSASLALLFRALCGNGAKSKRIPVALFTAPAKVIRAFLEAYIEGDGCWLRDHIAINTVSRELALGTVALLLRLSVFPYFYATPRSERYVIEGRRVQQSSTLYYVKCRRDAWVGRPASSRTRVRETQGAFWVPVRKISREQYEGLVYNLEIDDGGHSYIASGVAVANCQNSDISQLGHGRIVTPDQLAAMMLHLQDQGCHNINFVTPEHVVPQILEALPLAVERGLTLPIVYNTGSYDSMHSLRLLDGIVDIYMPDFKFWDREASRFYVKAPDYPEVARRTVREMHRQVGELKLDEYGLARRGVLIRHLVMPGRIAGTKEIMQWIGGEVSVHTYVNVMAQYAPAGRVGVDRRYDSINRRITDEEFADAVCAARQAGLYRLDARLPRHPWQRWTPGE